MYNLVSKLTGTENTNILLDQPRGIELAEEFSEFFLQNIEKIHSTLDGYNLFKPTGSEVLLKLTEFNVLDKSQVVKTLAKLQPKSCELDVIPTKILKEIIDSLIDPITKIVNISLRKGQFASEWKTAILRPLQKLGQDTLKNNYRPVDSLNFLSKLVEKYVSDQYTNHSDVNLLNAKHQSAYKVGYSCKTALLKICNDIFWSMEKKDIISDFLMNRTNFFWRRQAFTSYQTWLPQV